MDDMQVYIANLGKYNEGELVGAWFTFPIDFEEVKEKIGLNDEYEEYAIHDYELSPFSAPLSILYYFLNFPIPSDSNFLLHPKEKHLRPLQRPDVTHHHTS